MMTVYELLELARASGVRLYARGGRLKYWAESIPDPQLLNLLKESKHDIIRVLESQNVIPRLPWQLERLLIAATNQSLHFEMRGVADVNRYVMAWGIEYLAGDAQEALGRLWEVYRQWQQSKN